MRLFSYKIFELTETVAANELHCMTHPKLPEESNKIKMIDLEGSHFLVIKKTSR